MVKLVDNYWVDKNGNKWSAEYCTKKGAERLSETLINCFNCVNCINCKNCEYCLNCTDCFRCFECYGCERCEKCYNCDNCKNCIDCGYCLNCIDCIECFNQKEKVGKENQRNKINIDNVNKIYYNINIINDKKEFLKMENKLNEARNINLKLIEDLKSGDIILFWCCHKIKMKINKETAESIRNFFNSGNVDELTPEGKEMLMKLVNIKNMTQPQDSEVIKSKQ